MKDPKHFVRFTRVDGTKMSQAVILTPPLDTAEQAQAYADWFKAEGNHLRGALLLSLMNDKLPRTDTEYVTMTFETTLY